MDNDSKLLTEAYSKIVEARPEPARGIPLRGDHIVGNASSNVGPRPGGTPADDDKYLKAWSGPSGGIGLILLILLIILLVRGGL